MTTNRKRPEKNKPTGDRSPNERSKHMGRKGDDGPATEQRFQKRAQDPEPDQDMDDDKRYMTRLKPPDYKPSSYLWGFKDPAVDDEDRTNSSATAKDQESGGDNEQGSGDLVRDGDRED